MVLQAPALMKHLEEKLGVMLVRICSLIFMVVFILHIFACCFHFVALLDENSESWVEASGIVDPSSLVDRCAFIRAALSWSSAIGMEIQHCDCGIMYQGGSDGFS